MFINAYLLLKKGICLNENIVGFILENKLKYIILAISVPFPPTCPGKKSQECKKLISYENNHNTWLNKMIYLKITWLTLSVEHTLHWVTYLTENWCRKNN